MDANAYTIPFQFTKSLRRDVYPAIDPKNPEQNAAGKVVLITGAGGGIGGETARAWAIAGAEGIILVGRKASLLQEPAGAISSINKDVKVLTMTADLTSEADVEELFSQAKTTFGKVDVVVNTAGTMTGGPVGDMIPQQWWTDFEVNVKGTYTLTHHYLKTFGSSGTLINLVSLGASMTAPGISSYSTSKLAVIKLSEYLDAEKPDLRVFTLHPGIVAATKSKRGMVVDAFAPFAKDPGMLTGAVSLYLATPKAEYLRGGFTSVNWDVEEMEKHRDEIKEKKLLKLAFLNGKLGPEGYTW
ncbi:NAD(P)-binding protein [Aureobasidium pullulans EXF-150]|uniref:NAD(P)-binding protein n=1 Tax=Aureobasidium pullulans EXF-150 TaxID=1043002 RepID=A0A074XTX1_AURPU|nr:NAD(P)-binding protein [Aureobasidium pullulans EXF-150]KEQ88965.1 NAD(P)-binding protein [Aureobasidium pullulans EXF-150]